MKFHSPSLPRVLSAGLRSLMSILCASVLVGLVHGQDAGDAGTDNPYYVPPEARTKVMWIGPDQGLWSTKTNWSTGSRPQDGEDVFVTQSGTTVQTVVYDKKENFVPTFSSMLIEGTGGGALVFSQTGPHNDPNAIFSIDETVGRTGVGVFAQAGGVNFLNGGQGFNNGAAGSLVLGDQQTGQGTYYLSGTTAVLEDRVSGSQPLIIGNAGTGAFHQSGGLALNTRTILGKLATGVGSYTLNNDNGTPGADSSIPSIDEVNNALILDLPLPKTGVLYSDQLVIGDAGKGSFAQSGGINKVFQSLAIAGGFDANSTALDAQSLGSYELSGDGQLNVDFNSTVGNVGQGTFVQSGGNHTVGNDLILAQNPGAAGSYELSDGMLGVGARIYVGAAGAGSFRQSGGSISTEALYLAGEFVDFNPTGVAATATYELGADASLAVGKETVIGVAGTATFTQTGGNIVSTGMTVGYAGQGSFNQQGGVNTVAYEMAHGRQVGETGEMVLGSIAGGFGEYQMQGGLLKTEGLHVGFNGQGSFVQDAGLVHVALDGGGGVYVGSTSDTGSYAISGGELQSFGLYIGFAGVTAGSSYLHAGNGSFSQSGGIVTVQELEVGQPGKVGVAGIPTYHLSGGTLNVRFANIGGVFSQDLGLPGIFEQTGGVVQGYGANHIWVDGPGSRYDLTGGEIHTDKFVSYVGSQINQTGGTVFADSVGAAGASYNLSGSDSRIVTSSLSVGGRMTTGTDQILAGDFNQRGGDVTVTDTDGYGSVMQVIAGGSYRLSGNGRLTVNGDEQVGGRYFYYNPIDPDFTPMPLASQFNQTGGTHTVNGVLTVYGDQPKWVGADAGSVGNYVLAGGSLTADVIDNRGSFNFSGGSLAGHLDNSGTLTLSGPGTRTIDGAVTNTGRVAVDHTTAVYTGTFTNNGAYVSDPSTNVFTSLAVGSTGYLVGGMGDRFIVSDNFTNASTQNLFWNTSLADLLITGTGSHLFSLAGLDLGAVFDGYTDNFAWGGFSLAAGVGLDVSDGNDLSGAAFYTGLFELGGGFGQLGMIHSNFNIYYDPFLAGNAWLGDGTYDLDGSGRLIPIERAAATPETGDTLAFIALAFVALGWLHHRKLRPTNAST